jgi:hypothetical protein
MLTRIGLLATLAFVLCGCASREITDFRNTSVIYGWVNMDEAPSGIYSGQVQHLNARDKKNSYYTLGVDKFEDGYLFYHLGVDSGGYRMAHLSGQNCLLIFCSNTIHEYSFGEDSEHRFSVGAPGVYFIGAYDYKKIKTGFFQPGKFSFAKAKKAPTRRQMLERMLRNVEGDDSPGFAPALKRMRAELARTK